LERVSDFWTDRRAPARLGLIALVAVACVAAGLACLLLAMAPSQFAVLWLPSGIAVAALLRLGWRAWPGVFLGEALLAAVIMTPTSELSPGSLVAACLAVATGATLGPGMAWLILTRLAPGGEIFERLRAVGWLLVAAFLAGAISAGIGVGIVTAIGVIRLEAESCQLFAASAIRSAAAILLVAPFALAWEHQRVGSRRRWCLEMMAPIALTMSAVVIAYLYANEYLSEERHLAFERRASVIARSIEREFEVASGSVAALRDLYDATRQVDEDSFRIFTQRMLARQASLALIAWAPDLGSNGHYPLGRIGARDGSAVLSGFDLGRSPLIAVALERARDQGITAVSRTLRLPHAPERDDALVVARAIYRGSSEPQTPEARRAALSGFAIAVLHLGDVVLAASVGVPTDGLGYRLIDLTAPTTSWTFGGPARPDSPRWSGQFEVADRAWQIDVHSVNVYEPGIAFWGPGVVMIAGTLLAGVLGLFLLSSGGRAARIERLVLERTAELQRAQQVAIDANRTKSMVVADLSHDLRTPLTAIIGFADLLLEPGHAEAERHEWAQIVRRSAVQLLELVNDVLDVSKLEAGRLDVETIPTSPWHLIHEVIELMGERARSKGISCEAAWLGRVPEVIQSDPQRLRQILINLISNAVKFTESGGVLVVAQLARKSGGGDQLLVEVVDTGIGIPAAQISRLFEAFRQGDASTSRRYGGTGLGLRISRDLARLLGGDVEVESQVGVGTTFRLRIATGDLSGVRLIDPREEEFGADDAHGGTTGLDGEIWLIGGDAAGARLVARMLECAGASVVRIGSLDQVRLRLSQAAPDARAPVALVLGASEGPDAARALRAAGYAGPIASIDRRSDSPDAWSAAGCDVRWIPPLDRKQVVEGLAGLIARR
jgi:signal transduction histidine kinase/integral membrane sensor domain MASE1